MKFIDLNQKGWQWAVLLFLAFIWGSSFILMKKSLLVFDPLQVASIRMSVGAVALLPFAIRYFGFLKKNVWLILLVGLIGNGIPAYLFTFSQMHVSSSNAGILNSLTPLFTLIMGIVLFRKKTFLLQVTGVLIGLAGSVLLFVNKDFSFDYDVFTWGLLIVLATAMYGVNINHVKHNLKDVPGFAIASLAFMLILPLTATMFFINLPETDIIDHPDFTSALTSVMLLAVLGSALAVAVMNVLIKYTSTVFSSSVTYIMPAIAMMWGVNDNENIGWSSVIALILILAGVYIVQFKSEKNNGTK